MLVQMGRLVEDANLFKVAIVTDNVAALLEIDPLDYIRKIQVFGVFFKVGIYLFISMVRFFNL